MFCGNCCKYLKPEKEREIIINYLKLFTIKEINENNKNADKLRL